MSDPTWKYTPNTPVRIWPRLYSFAHQGKAQAWGIAGYDGAYFLGEGKTKPMQQMADEQGKESYDFVSADLEYRQMYTDYGRPVADEAEGVEEAQYNAQRQADWLAQSRYLASMFG